MRGDSNDEKVAMVTMIVGVLMGICCIAGIVLGNVWMFGIPVALAIFVLLLALALYKNWLPRDLRYDLKLIEFLKTIYPR